MNIPKCVIVEGSDEKELLLLQMNQQEIAELDAAFAGNRPQEQALPQELQDLKKPGGKQVSDLESQMDSVEL